MSVEKDLLMKRTFKSILLLLAIILSVTSFSACGEESETVSVTYSLGGGSISGDLPESYEKGDAPNFSKIVPKREHYDFVGWYIDGACTVAFRESAIEGDHVTLHAKWKAHEYNVFYELNGGTGEELPDKYNYGTALKISVLQPKKENYKFDGWYIDPEFKTLKTKIFPTDFGDITLHAKWSPVE